MNQTSLPASPYCTIGPFFPGEFAEGCGDLTNFEGRRARGQHIVLRGRIVEEGDRPIQNAIIEIWQPDANGIFRHPLDPRFDEVDPGFFGWGRARTGPDGGFEFRTVMPGAYPAEDGTARCPHLNLMVLAIGLTRRLVTTVFFGAAAQVSDPVLNCVSGSARRELLFAISEKSINPPADPPAYRFDIVTRGQNETPFFVD